MYRLTLIFAMLLGLAGPACAASAAPEAGGESARYQALRAAQGLRDVPLSVHPSCRDAAPVLPARTVGDYLAGFMASMDSGSNRITSRCVPEGRGQRCELWLKHADGEDQWGWGIRYDTDARGQALPRSVQCLGAG